MDASHRAIRGASASRSAPAEAGSGVADVPVPSARPRRSGPSPAPASRSTAAGDRSRRPWPPSRAAGRAGPSRPRRRVPRPAAPRAGANRDSPARPRRRRRRSARPRLHAIQRSTTPPDLVAPQPLAPVRQRELGLGFRGAPDSAVVCGSESSACPFGTCDTCPFGTCQSRHLPVRQGHVPFAFSDDHPGEQRVDAGPRDRDRGVGAAHAGLDEPPEVHQVVAAPAGLLLGRAGTCRIDGPQCVGDDRSADRRRAPPSVRSAWKDRLHAARRTVASWPRRCRSRPHHGRPRPSRRPKRPPEPERAGAGRWPAPRCDAGNEPDEQQPTRTERPGAAAGDRPRALQRGRRRQERHDRRQGLAARHR